MGIRAVQPRACGEHLPNLTTRLNPSGSAPRVRGTQAKSQPERRDWRFSPARAGNTCAGCRYEPVKAVQPRACGEHQIAGSVIDTNNGSAPRVRGTRTPSRKDGNSCRFSPARAGNTLALVTRWLIEPVQPRACGEHCDAVTEDFQDAGSAPRVRGTRRPSAHMKQIVRFSPARAGNTIASTLQMLGIPVQPRACGEHDRVALVIGKGNGSAPRVRGTHRFRIKLTSELRFSPARAGNTNKAVFAASPRSVQPRACGEHGPLRFPGPPVAGSAPRVRGTRRALALEAPDRRFSPARAGNTKTGMVVLLMFSVQPRACGEHSISTPNVRDSNGSAPRVRGTPPPRGRHAKKARFSPARAGNTSCSADNTSASAGSAPRVRGTPGAEFPRWDIRRFSPARAGNTIECELGGAGLSVQPRACGEHANITAPGILRAGSAPRVRGTPWESRR